ncbi:Uncharacterized protein PHSC3_001163 [Chlamydiales bacterium STE3]|nr:Uncharacterized protein PHSC3_001163 [Chlamydiales bacterium STE3]
MEVIKKINELAYSAGRAYQSQETGFLHLSYHLPEDQSAHSIPTLENILFALSLLKLKTQESVLEAKDLIEKILHFQTESGNFPIHLHEYPKCHNPFLGADLLPAFYWILSHFGSIIGERLKTLLQQAIDSLLDFNLQAIYHSAGSTIIKMKLATAAMALGKKEEGQALWDSLNLEQESFWHVPELLGEAMIAFQMMQAIPERILETWHSELKCYVGPSLREYHKGLQKEWTLYDLYMAALTDNLPKRTDKPHFVLLKGALIQPGCAFSHVVTYPSVKEGTCSEVPYMMAQEKYLAFSLLGKQEIFSNQKGYHPFYFLWGASQILHSLVMQGGNVEQISFKTNEKKIELFIDLKSSFDVEDREACKEISFFTEVDPQSALSVDGYKATTFLLGQTVHLDHPEMKINLDFSLAQGEGVFKGHIMRANRPSQKKTIGNDRFTAYDWQIFLRTLQRTEPCQIKVTISYEAIETA